MLWQCPLDFAGEASRKEVEPMDIIVGLAACCTIATFVVQAIRFVCRNIRNNKMKKKQ